VEIVREAYRPTETEVDNVEHRFKQLPACHEIYSDENSEVSFEAFQAIFEEVVCPALGKLHLQLGWEVIREVYSSAITQLARHSERSSDAFPPVHNTTNARTAMQLYSEELRSLWESIMTSSSSSTDASSSQTRSFVKEMVA